MGACASKPKVLGDKFRRSRRNSSSNSNYNYNGAAPSISSTARSSLKEEKRSLSFSEVPNKDETIITPKEDEDVGSKTIVANHYVHRDELPSNGDDDLDNNDRNVHFGASTKDHETDHIVSAVTNAIEEDENVVVEEPTFKEEASGLTPTHELKDHIPNKSSTEALNPAGPHPQNSSPPYTIQNDVVETENPAGTTLEGQKNVAETTNLVGVLLQDPDSPPPTENDVVETISISETAPHINDVVEAVSPAGVVQLQMSPPPSYTSKNVVVESTLKPDGMQTLISSSTTSHHTSKDLVVVDLAELHGPIKIHSSVVYDHVPLVNKLEARNNEGDDVITTNAMPSTFAF